MQVSKGFVSLIASVSPSTQLLHSPLYLQHSNRSWSIDSPAKLYSNSVRQTIVPFGGYYFYVNWSETVSIRRMFFLSALNFGSCLAALCQSMSHTKRLICGGSPVCHLFNSLVKRKPNWTQVCSEEEVTLTDGVEAINTLVLWSLPGTPTLVCHFCLRVDSHWASWTFDLLSLMTQDGHS